MPRDDALPTSRLQPHVGREQVVRHFPEAFGVRVDREGLDLVQERERISFEGARLPEPPEAVLMDRVLQLVPVEMLRGVERIVILPSRGTARYGGYLNGIICLGTDAATRRLADAEFGGRFSLFTTTLLHEVSHAIYQVWLTHQQRAEVIDAYLDRFIEREQDEDGEPTTRQAEHFFIDLVMGVLLRVDTALASFAEARALLGQLGVPLD